MLEYKRSLKARKLTVEQLSTEIKTEIYKLAAIEKSMIEAETAENVELLDTLNSQFVELDSKIADAIDDFTPVVKPAKEEPKKDSEIPTTQSTTDPPEEKKEGANTGLIVGALALIGIGIAVFFGAKKK